MPSQPPRHPTSPHPTDALDCVERSDGIFYPSRVPGSLQFGSDKGTPDNPHTSAITFHAWDSMRSLAERGLDPLKVLVDRAHEKDMEFWADLRLSTYGGMPEAFKLANGKNQLSFPGRSHGSELRSLLFRRAWMGASRGASAPTCGLP